MLIFSNRHQINSTQWDNFITASPQRILYAYSWYLDTVSPNWQALILAENDQWQAVMPLPCRKKWGLNVVQQPFFCQLLGVFTNSSIDYREASNLLLTELTTSFRYISTYSGRFAENTVLPEGLKVTNAANLILPLHHPYSVLFQHYTRDRQTNLKRAQQYKWTAQQSTDIDPLIQLFTKNHAAQIEGGVSENAYDLLRAVTALLAHKKALRLVYAVKNESIEAGTLFAIFNNRIIYLFNAASPAGRQGNARTWLIDQMICEYAETDFVFDFESPDIPSIASFYQSFGAQEEEYSQLAFSNLPFPLKQIQEWRVKKSGKSINKKRVKSHGNSPNF